MTLAQSRLPVKTRIDQTGQYKVLLAVTRWVASAKESSASHSLWIALTLIELLVVVASSERRLRAAEPVVPGWMPLTEIDRAIPTLAKALEYDWGAEVTPHSDMERYLQALAVAAPDRAKLLEYGRSYEGRRLYHLIITAPENMARLEEIRQTNLRLADPRLTTPEEAKTIAASHPAILWLMYCVHGNETSPTDAALATAYHLLADISPAGRERLRRLVVIIDPLQNPDGRDRFIQSYREMRGVAPDPQEWAVEHTERWPGGRYNHYLIDMNRDWFLQSQVESRERVRRYLQWQPQLLIDAHEMSINYNYYFDPPAEPIAEMITQRQREWLNRLGREQGARFDREGVTYFTREVFDAFYPGYGSTWPMMHGAIGILWEQGRVRGLLLGRPDDLELRYAHGVRNHFLSGLVTLEVAEKRRVELLQDFYQSRAEAIRMGEEGPIRNYYLLEDSPTGRAAAVAQLLLANGVEVRRTTKDLRIRDEPLLPVLDSQQARLSSDDAPGNKATLNHAPGNHAQPNMEVVVPAGSFQIRAAQPAGRLARALLDRHVDMGKPFILRQQDRIARRLEPEIYDVTAWSVPLSFGVRCATSRAKSEPLGELLQSVEQVGKAPDRPALVAYAIASEEFGLPGFLCAALRSGLRVHVADQPLRAGNLALNRGSLLIRTPENGERVHDLVRRLAMDQRVTVHALDSGFVESGAHPGGTQVSYVRPPKIAMLFDRPADFQVGHTWYLFDQVWQYPVTRIAGRHLQDFDLEAYHVLILPHGSYVDNDGPDEDDQKRIKSWVKRGGTLILVKGAARWAARESVGMLSTERVYRPQPNAAVTNSTSATAPGGSPPAEAKKPNVSSAADTSNKPRQDSPIGVHGAFLQAKVYQDHWITFGFPEEFPVMFTGNLLFQPLAPRDGRNLVTFAGAPQLVSGFCWPETLDLIAQKPYVMTQVIDQGHVVAFADDPNYRAMYPFQQRLFFNAVMFGPAHKVIDPQRDRNDFRKP